MKIQIFARLLDHAKKRVMAKDVLKLAKIILEINTAPGLTRPSSTMATTKKFDGINEQSLP